MKLTQKQNKSSILPVSVFFVMVVFTTSCVTTVEVIKKTDSKAILRSADVTVRYAIKNINDTAKEFFTYYVIKKIVCREVPCFHGSLHHFDYVCVAEARKSTKSEMDTTGPPEFFIKED